jgi:enhancing lycopene biosynthesis protein 2
MERVAVLLAGCGVYDGTEVHEAVLAELALDRRGAATVFLAPEGDQSHVVDHTTGSAIEGAPSRSMLLESARIGRGRVEPLRPFSYEGCSALIVPGGAGAAGNLLTGFLESGLGRKPRGDVAEAVRYFHERGRPLGGISLGQSVVAAALERELSEEILRTPATEVLVDEQIGLIATPGYLTARGLAEVAEGVDRLVEELLARGRRTSGRLPSAGGKA